MDNQILGLLKKKLEEAVASSTGDPEVLRNALKEELQYYVLDFIYHHPEYRAWVMYGGSALRICHDLDRMSVDLDFEVSNIITEEFLKELQDEIRTYFENTYQVGSDLLTIKVNHGRGLVLRFFVGERLGLGHASDQVHIKIELNTFVAPKVVTERHPINRNQLSFVIVSYNMSALMASKIAAIFLRGQRGVGEALYEEKSRDIYDLLWYMEKKIVPDFDYLSAKHVEQAKDIRTLFTKLTIKMNSVSKENLKQDLSPLFFDQRYITNWLTNWHESYLRLVEAYKIRTITELKRISIFEDFHTDVFFFTYEYATVEGSPVRVAYAISDYWMDFGDGDIPTVISNRVEELVSFSANGATSHP
ncbi:MAG: nucleotidyl transferase AbiEii/AbiGii toxin family protein, partial [Patescibacteria group bacterium]